MTTKPIPLSLPGEVINRSDLATDATCTTIITRSDSRFWFLGEIAVRLPQDKIEMLVIAAERVDTGAPQTALVLMEDYIGWVYVRQGQL